MIIPCEACFGSGFLKDFWSVDADGNLESKQEEICGVCGGQGFTHVDPEGETPWKE